MNNWIKNRNVLVMFIFLLASCAGIAAQNQEIIKINLTSENFPKYISYDEVLKEFGFISAEFFVSGVDEKYGKIIEKVRFYSNLDGQKMLIATVDKNGILNDDGSIFFTKGFDPTSDFVRRSFIGFSEGAMKKPFLLYGIARSSNGKIYDTEVLLMIDIDMDKLRLCIHKIAY